MTPTEYRAALDALGLKQTGKLGADALFKVSQRTAQRWASGEAEIPEAVAIALRLMVERGVEGTRSCTSES